MVDGLAACALCGLTSAYPVRDEAGRAFCCPACREVSLLLAADAGDHADAAPAGEGATSTMALCLGGLWCPSCSWLIAETLQRSPGVRRAEVSFIQREAQVVYDPAQTDPRRVARRVRRLGYRAWLPGDKGHDDEEAQWNRLLISGVLVMHIMVISFLLYGRDGLGLSSPDTEWLAGIFNLISLLASLPVLLILGLPILRAGSASLLRGRPNIHTLVALGAFSAFALSVRNLTAGQGRVYFDTAAVLLFLVAVGRWLEMRAQKRGAEAVERLYARLPTEAVLVTPEGERRAPLDEVSRGARLRIRPGEHFPVDGIVASGLGDVDESLLTGEPRPETRRAGDRVLAGTTNLDGAFEVLATAIGAETAAGRVGQLLHQALWRRAPIERQADRLAALMTPVALLLALATFAFWSVQAGPERGLIYALSVLLIACPCALGIATPLVMWLGLGRAAEAGAILRDTSVLERLAGARWVFFDKTGTLTQRAIHLRAVAADDGDAGAFLAQVAALEEGSEHPFGRAIVASAGQQLPAAPIVHDFRSLPGRGVTGRLDGVTLWAGSRRLMSEAGLATPPQLAEQAAAWRRQGLSVVYAGRQGRVTGILGLGEQVRPEAGEALASLRGLGLEVAVLTGDDAAAGARWAQRLNAPVFAEQKPEDKLSHLQGIGEEAVMVGDGINDGPALAAAAVGIALSQGADVTQAAAAVLLLNDDLRAVSWLVQLARIAMRKVRQNLVWAMAYNVFGLGLAVTGHLQPVIAALLMVASSIVVTTNALRLRSVAIGRGEAEGQSALPAAAEPLAGLQELVTHG